MPDILRPAGRAEIGLSIIQAIVIYMVAIHPRQHGNHQVVHLQISSRLFFAVGERVNGVKGVDALVGVPFIFLQTVVILRINDGEFAKRQRYPAERIAVANPPI